MAANKKTDLKFELLPQTRLVDFITSGQLEQARLLISQSANQDFLNQIDPSSGKTPIIAACDDQRSDAIEMLIDFGADISVKSATGDTALIYVSRRNNVSILKYLIEHGADVNSTGSLNNTALHFACMLGYKESIEYLISVGANLSIRNELSETPLSAILKFDFFKLAPLILGHGADINSKEINENTPLMRACFDGRFDTAKFIIENGGDFQNIKNISGDTAFHIACKRSHFKIAALMAERGILIDDRDGSNRTLLMHGCMVGNLQLVKFALGHNANPELSDSWGFTPIMFAARLANGLEIVKILVERDVDLNYFDRSYNTATFYACKSGNYQAAKLMIEHGANPGYSNEDNIRALDLVSDPEWKNVLSLTAANSRPKQPKTQQPPKPKWLKKLAAANLSKDSGE